MIVDTSALVAILRDESDAHHYKRALLVADVALMSAASFVEVAMVIDGRRDAVSSHQLDNLTTHTHIRIEPSTRRRPASPARRSGTTARAAAIRLG